LFCSAELNAQELSDTKQYSFDFRGEALTEVLEDIARKTGIDLVYDPEIVSGVTIYSRIQNQSIPALFKTIRDDTKLDFLTLSSASIVIVLTVDDDPSYGSYAGKIVDRHTE
jgi:hypothetical protein